MDVMDVNSVNNVKYADNYYIKTPASFVKDVKLRILVEAYATRLASLMAKKVAANLLTPKEALIENESLKTKAAWEDEDSTSLSDTGKRLTNKQFQQLATFIAIRYLLQDSDAQPQNYFVVGENIASIDYGLAFYSVILDNIKKLSDDKVNQEEYSEMSERFLNPKSIEDILAAVCCRTLPSIDRPPTIMGDSAFSNNQFEKIDDAHNKFINHILNAFTKIAQEISSKDIDEIVTKLCENKNQYISNKLQQAGDILKNRLQILQAKVDDTGLMYINSEEFKNSYLNMVVEPTDNENKIKEECDKWIESLENHGVRCWMLDGENLGLLQGSLQRPLRFTPDTMRGSPTSVMDLKSPLARKQ